MYIQPNGIIQVMHCPLNQNSEDTFYFASVDEQTTAMAAYVIASITAQSYTRTNEGVVRCSLPMSTAYNVNYLRYRNQSFENKWFYAFVTKVEYVNNGLCLLYFKIDTIQTWFIGQATLNQCYVERETTETDNIGEHIEPEGINCQEYVFNDYAKIVPASQDFYAIIVSVCDSSVGNGRIYDGVYGGTYLWCMPFDPSNSASVDNAVTDLNAFLSNYTKSPDSVVSIYMIPAYALGLTDPLTLLGSGGALDTKAKGANYVFTLPSVSTSDTIDGYKPKNRKLYTYPFNYLQVDNANGSSLALRYEFFPVEVPTIRIDCTITQPVEVTLRPTNYKNIGVSNTPTCTEVLTIKNFPQCSWNTDSFKAWLAQSTVPNIIKAGASIAGGVAAAATGNPLTGTAMVMNGLNTASSILTEGYEASIKADTLSGNFDNGGSNTAAGLNCFHQGRLSITAERAKQIDDYFTAYGYKVGRVKVPNISARPHFNYTKTANCSITANAPSDDIKDIENRFNNGIRFWKDKWMDFTVDNL